MVHTTYTMGRTSARAACGHGLPRLGPRPRWRLELIQAGDVLPGNQDFLLLWHVGQNLVQNLPALRPRGLLVGIIRAPHQILDTNNSAVPDAHHIFLEAAEDVLAEEIARQHCALEAVPVGAAGPLGVGVIEAVQEVRNPGEFLFNSADL